MSVRKTLASAMALSACVSSALLAVGPASAAPPAKECQGGGFVLTVYEGPFEGTYGEYISTDLWDSLDRNGNGKLCVKELKYIPSNPTNLVDPPINMIDDLLARGS